MPSNLATAIDELYAAFSSQPKPKRIAACPCCVPADEYCALLETPLRKLTGEQLSAFASSLLLTAGSEDDLRYFFPRMLDIAIHERYWWPDREVVLGKLSLGRWQTWPDREQAAVLSVVGAAFQAALQDPSDGAWNIDAWLCGLALAGADVHPFLATLANLRMRARYLPTTSSIPALFRKGSSETHSGVAIARHSSRSLRG